MGEENGNEAFMKRELFDKGLDIFAFEDGERRRGEGIALQEAVFFYGYPDSI